jgi:hypothetical protein
MNVSFLIEGGHHRAKGELVQENAKTIWVRFSGALRDGVIKRHKVKHAVEGLTSTWVGGLRLA